MKQIPLKIDIRKYIPDADRQYMFECNHPDVFVNGKQYKIPYLASGTNEFVLIDEDDELPQDLQNIQLEENNCKVTFEVITKTPRSDVVLTGWAITKIELFV